MEKELEKILCTPEIESLKTKFIRNGWVTISHKTVYCALAYDDNTAKALKHTSWDLRPSESFPTFYENETDGSYDSYSRFGDEDYEPLVFWREPPIGKIEYYREVSQEFLLFHNLYEKQEKGATIQKRKYIHIADNGDEEDYVIIDKYSVQIKIKALREYLWARRINLIIFIDSLTYSRNTYEELGIDGKTYNETIQGGDFVYIYSQLPAEAMQYHSDGQKSGAHIMGKCVIRYSKSKIAKEEEYEKFIIDIDEDGDEITFTCDDNKLSNGFGRNEGAPDTLTPIYFRKDVLDKYYGDTDKYDVEDGYLRCGGLWGLHIDNNNSDYVIVMLYDLGRIPYKEQQYWRQFNILRPSNAGMSSTSFIRWICGNSCDPVNPDLKFKEEYSRINKQWYNRFGWYLFLPLTSEDSHRKETLHSLTKKNNEQEFEEQVLSLVKLTIDSLNQEELLKKSDIGKEKVIKYLESKKYDSLSNVTKGIERFEVFLLSNDIEASDIITFLKMVYALRSFDIAHRKSSDPKKRKNIVEYFGYETKSKREILDGIFSRFIDLFNMLEKVLLKTI